MMFLSNKYLKTFSTVAVVLCLSITLNVQAASITFIGSGTTGTNVPDEDSGSRPISGSVTFAYDFDPVGPPPVPATNFLYITLTNTTTGDDIVSAGQLLTGLSFSLLANTTDNPSATLDMAGADKTISIDNNGAITQNGFIDLMTAKQSGPNFGPTWSLDSTVPNSNPGNYFLNFNPDAKYAIMGPP